MCQLNYRPLHCIIPPYVLENILQKGSSRQKEKAQYAIGLAGQMRGQRQAFTDIILKPQATQNHKNRLVYTAQNTNTLPGVLARKEGDSATGDPQVDEAYEGAGATYDLYDQIFGRNSIDNNGMDLISTIRYMKGYDNAFWNGEQMVYGEGDEDLPEEERLFNRFTIAIDIIGHELTHGITQYEANLVYQGQSGALNESFSDVFGSLVKQRVKKQTAVNADWIIGEGLFTSNVNGVGIRSMKQPGSAYNDPTLGTDPQPGHMNEYVETTRDNGGVHINSGIPNKAFYLTALEIGGYAWEKAGKIWYMTLKEKLSQTANFEQAANITYQVAGDLYGQNSLEQVAVAKAWKAVGLPIQLDKKQE
ncbi:M4 family metallopeptidase [Saccharicrinis fermentans]|uniref:Neutral metalloproteinase n=1 Tax=Saccharicrinis fermentans DSM 9555 = JCM 21142 TaxID=869213 RepID=W7YBF4_9BACT|nr:M4 family metallopeptidase [Saccharicrinis fermentans]GAF01751.1 protease PrtS precursor [Saccharicrinis fermentans DSM 9555 = JCM 21142]